MIHTARYTALFVVLLIVQVAAAQTKTVPFKVISLTSRQWMSGAAPGKAGITYTYKILLLSNKKVSFKDTWIGKEYAPVEVQTFYTDPNHTLTSGDSVILVYTLITKPEVKTESKTISKSVPFKYKGTALIEYLYEGKTRYFTVKQPIEVLRTIKGV